MTWIIGTLVIAVVAFYCGAVMSTGSWAPWRGQGRRRA